MAVVSSIPPCLTFRMPLARKATGNHLKNSNPQEKLRALSQVFATLEIEYAKQFISGVRSTEAWDGKMSWRLVKKQTRSEVILESSRLIHILNIGCKD